MKSKTRSYPGFSILFSIGSYRKPSIEKDINSIKINFLFFTIMFTDKDLNNLLESYHDSLLTMIKELQDAQNK